MFILLSFQGGKHFPFNDISSTYMPKYRVIEGIRNLGVLIIKMLKLCRYYSYKASFLTNSVAKGMPVECGKCQQYFVAAYEYLIIIDVYLKSYIDVDTSSDPNIKKKLYSVHE